MMASLFNFLSLNVGGSASLAGLCGAFSLRTFDMIFLQEVKSTQCQVDSLIARFGYSSLVNVDGEDSHKPGTALI